MEIREKVVFITGSASRVGKTIALAFAQKGARIVVHYLNREKEATVTAREIEKMGRESIVLKGDVSIKEDWLQMTNLVLEKWGRVDVLVNNAAIFYKTPFFDAREEDFENFVNVNLKSVFLGCQIVGKEMVKRKAGKIINIADVSAENIWPSYIPYCVSKAGVVAFTKGLAKALAPFITVNAISPGTVLLAEEYDEAEENALIQKTPLQRVGTPEDIASAAVFLVEGSDFITGEILKVDGGRSLN